MPQMEGQWGCVAGAGVELSVGQGPQAASMSSRASLSA